MKTDTPFKLNLCTVKPREFSIELSSGEKKILQPKFIEVLTYLATQYPRLVDRKELIDEIWDGNHFVGEKSLTNAIWNLRNELKETNESYIETVRRKGYRLLVEPEYLTEEKALNDTSAKTVNKGLFKKSINWLVLAVVLLVALVSNIPFDDNELPLEETAIITQISHSPGREVYPVVSPDQKHIIFSWRRIGHQPNLFIRDYNDIDQTPKQLTHSDDYEGPAVWHPNGEIIFYPRKHWDYSTCEIIKLNIITTEQQLIGQCTGELDFSLSVSPDGSMLAYIEVDHSNHTKKVKFIDTMSPENTLDTYQCESRCNFNDLDSIFSPDGNYLAVSRTYDEGLNEDIFLFNIKDKTFKQLTNNQGDIKGMAWHPEGDRIIYSSRVAGKRNGYIVDVNSLKIVSLDIPGFSYPRFIPNSNTVVYHSWLVNSQLSSISIDESLATAPFPVLHSDFSYHSPHYSAVTNRLVFISNHSGYDEVWTSRTDGTDPRKLTNLQSHLTFPRWSNNGQYIAFLGPKENSSSNALYMLNVKSSVVKTLKSEFDQHYRPSWNNKDDKIIAAARHKGKRSLYAFPIDDSPAELILDQKVKYAEQADDGTIWYSLGRNSGLWKFNPDEDNPTPTLVLNDSDFRVSYNWELTAQGLYFQHDYADHHQINVLNFDTQLVREIVKLPTGTIQRMASMAVIPEEERIVFTQLEFPNVDIKQLKHPFLN